MRALVVIPTYNEADNIGLLIAELRREAPEVDVLVVDDDSPDGTAGIVRGLQAAHASVHLIVRKKRDGFAGAYLEGLGWGMTAGYDAIIQMDADFSHPPAVVRKLLAALETSDVVIGNRYLPGGGFVGWSWYRKLISRCGNLYAETVLGVPVRDLTGGFVAWRSALLATLHLPSVRAKGYAFMIELKYRAYLRRARMAEVAFVFPDRTRGVSKMSFAIFREAALAVLRLRRSRALLEATLAAAPEPIEPRRMSDDRDAA